MTLASCQPPSTSTQAVCAFSAVVDVNAFVNRLAEGWKSGPIVGGAVSRLHWVTFSGSFVEEMTDASDVTLPSGPIVVRLQGVIVNPPPQEIRPGFVDHGPKGTAWRRYPPEIGFSRPAACPAASVVSC